MYFYVCFNDDKSYKYYFYTYFTAFFNDFIFDNGCIYVFCKDFDCLYVIKKLELSLRYADDVFGRCVSSLFLNLSD